MMPLFTFEITRLGEAPVVADKLTLLDDTGVWCHVEVLALQFRKADGAVIQVKNPDGNVIIRAGVATALASIQKCRCVFCPVKNRFDELFVHSHCVEPDLLAILDRLDYGAFVISPGGDVVTLNARAEAALGDVLTMREGRLLVSSAPRQKEFERLLCMALDAKGDVDNIGAVVLARPNGRRPLILQMTPLTRSFFPGFFFKKPNLCLAVVLDLESFGASSGSAALDSLGLTSAEIKVATLIGDGLDPQGISDQLGVSVGTVRTHLKRVYLKLGVRRQADLVHLLARLKVLN
jgi:DNA-binding CsgD family transcriptional regulator